ncbi:DNA primase [archaeon]|nr:DNA primase [archaeon]
MGKIALVTAKYIIHAQISIEGVVDRPDVIGAIFGQTEGLLGSELELRELQRNGKIGRIEVNMKTIAGKSNGEIIIPSSLDKTETAIIAAALETIQRIGPCNAIVKSTSIEDVRISKRKMVIDRAKALLKDLTDNTLPDSQEITEEVSKSVRMMEIKEYGKDRLAAGPAIEDSDEIIIVEGRADVLNLLKNGIKNSIAMNGTSAPQTIIDLTKRKIVTLFVDGDRGGDLIIRELKQVAEIDFVTKAPDGKEVEEITKKEINKALRSKIAMEQMTMDIGRAPKTIRKPVTRGREIKPRPRETPLRPKETSRTRYKPKLTPKETEKYTKMLDDLMGTRGAYILDEESNILGKVPTTELSTTIKNLGSGIDTVIFDGVIDSDLVRIAERSGIKNLIAMNSKVTTNYTKIKIITKKEL